MNSTTKKNLPHTREKISAIKKMLFTLFVSIPMLVHGQRHIIGIQGGVNSTNITASDIFKETDSRIGFVCGLGYSYRISYKFRSGIEINYAQQGFRETIRLTDEYGYETGQSGKIEFNYNYLSIPLKVGYQTNGRLNVVPALGIVPAFLLNARTIFPEVSLDWYYRAQETVDVGSKVSTFDIGGLAELAVEFKISEKLLLYPAISYRHSFTTFSNKDYFDGSGMRHYGFTLSAGIKYVFYPVGPAI